ncbi:MAG: hypothetical protein KA885_09975 [Spirochaetes bacterium]|nr:hypothetical protein [Spirochaetota bacterium]
MKDETKRILLIILVGKINSSAVEVQRILSDHGCYIKTRLGLHDSSDKYCSESGLIILELIDDEDKAEELSEKLEMIKDVSVKLISMSLKE